MSYTTPTDILKYFLGLAYEDSEGNDNFITEADATQFIEEQTAIIDLQIGKKYTLPLTDSDDLTYLKIVCDKLVVCQIDKTLRTFSNDDENEFVRRRNYCKEGNDMIKNIMDGKIPLNATEKSFRAIKYNKTTVYDSDCDCRQEEVTCSE